MKWFNAYEYILNGMEGSYRDGAPNTALHTDICSPLATDPTWSRLASDQRATLEAHGTQLWHRLIAYLAPDVLLVSIARHRVDSITLTSETAWQTIHSIPQKKKPYEVRGKKIRVIEGKSTFLIFGPAANTPFGTVSYPNKQIIGEHIKEYING